jgi:hypothetical protein
MRRRVGVEQEPPAAEVDRRALRRDRAGRQDDRPDLLRSDELGEAGAVELAACGQRLGERGVADELRGVIEEGRGGRDGRG